MIIPFRLIGPSVDGALRWLVNAGRRQGAALALAASLPLSAAPAAAVAAEPAVAAPAGPPIRLLALGDSLVAGYGVAERDAFPAQLEAALRARGYHVEVLNAGVSGDTTAGGLARLDWALAEAPDLVLVELGANDALRGLDPAVVRANLAAILESLRRRGLPVLLAGMYAPRNWGADYAAAFDRIYPELAQEYGVPLYPFFLDGVVTDRAFNQGDGIHPNEAGVRLIVERITPHVIALIRSAGLAQPAESAGAPR